MENTEINLHTMLFLDIQNTKHMTVNEGAQLLLEAEEQEGGGQLKERIAVGIARAGSDDATVKADILPALVGFDFGGPLHIMVVPAKLHFMEAKALMALAGAPPRIAHEAE
jgi:diphthine synthase